MTEGSPLGNRHSGWSWRTPVAVGAAALVGFWAATAGAASSNFSMNAGDTAHVSCGGPSLSVANQTATGLDLACAPNASTSTTAASTTTTARHAAAVSIDQIVKASTLPL